MAGESTKHELKSNYDPTDPAAKVKLVRNLVALANSGGGEIVFGASETSGADAGLDAELLKDLDGAVVSDLVNRYTQPRSVSVSHEIEAVEHGRVIIRLSIDPAGKYPLVLSRQGHHSDSPNPLFRPGDIFVRHGAKTEPAKYEDLVDWIDRVLQEDREKVLDRIGTVVRLPEGMELAVASPVSGATITPATLLDLKLAQREHHVGAMLDGNELLWSFVQRESFEDTDARVDLLIRSALRRTATLYFWLSRLRTLDRIPGILMSSLKDADRDKSDAQTSILEVACLLTTDNVLDALIEEMKSSSYAHFRDAADRWKGRADTLRGFGERVGALVVDDVPAVSLTDDELTVISDRLARSMLADGRASAASSRRLGDLGRVIFSRTDAAARLRSILT